MEIAKDKGISTIEVSGCILNYTLKTRCKSNNIIALDELNRMISIINLDIMINANAVITLLEKRPETGFERDSNPRPVGHLLLLNNKLIIHTNYATLSRGIWNIHASL